MQQTENKILQSVKFIDCYAEQIYQATKHTISTYKIYLLQDESG